MKIRIERIVFLFLAVSLLALSAQAQRPALSDESRIRELRGAYSAMANHPPPPDAPDATDYQRRLGEILVQLQRLLLKKTGSLETRINGLQAAAQSVIQVQDQARQLRDELRSVEDEIQQIDRQFEQSGRPAIPQPPNQGEIGNANNDQLTQEDREALESVKANLARERTAKANTRAEVEKARTEFDEKLATVTPDVLKDAALPPEVNSPPPACNERGRPAVIPYSKLDEALCRLGRDIGVLNTPFSLERQESNILTILIAKLLKTKTEGATLLSDGEESYSSFVTAAQEIRTDQQMGAGPTSGNSNSLVSKGGLPYLFGFAVENGVAERTQNDTAVTFRFNPGGVLNMFAQNGFITGFQGTDNDPVQKFLRKTSVGLTFDTSRGDLPGTFTANKQQLSQIQTRIEFVNERDPRHKKYLADWEKFVANEGVKLAQQISKTTVALTNWADPETGDKDMTFKDPVLQAWLLKTQAKIREVDSGLEDAERINTIAKVISEQADQLPIKEVSKSAVETLTEFAAENKKYLDEKNNLLDKIAKGKVFTLDYTNKREVNAPDTSTFNFIAATGAGARVDLTANGSLTLFHSLPAATALAPKPGRFRDFQFAGQVDIPFKVGGAQFDFWFSGRYERLLEDATTFTGAVIPGTKGDIAIGQFGLNIPIPGLGMKFPVSFTFANRTELVKEKEIRGNFGFTFNWDTLFSKIKPF